MPQTLFEKIWNAHLVGIRADGRVRNDGGTRVPWKGTAINDRDEGFWWLDKKTVSLRRSVDSDCGWRGRGVERMPLYTIAELQQMAQEWVSLEYQQTPDAGLRDPFRPHVVLSPNDMYAVQVARSGYRAVPLRAGWSDVGTWRSVRELRGPSDERGNLIVSSAPVLAPGVRDLP